MKIQASLIFASIFLVSACSEPQQDKANSQPQAASASVYNYQCESGEKIVATYPTTDSAKIQYKGNDYDMKIAVSASGARYVGDDLEWWTKGTGAGAEGTLFRHMDDGATGESVESCTES